MSTDTIAVIAMTVCNLAGTGATLLVALRVADRVRVVNPVKQAQPGQPPAVEAPIDLKTGRSIA